MNWIKQHKWQFLSIVLVLLLAAFFRFYKIDQYMTFLGDEGRDALVVKKILVLHDFPLLGPVTSVGNMYLGPLYYYMMAGAMAISWMNPVAAASLDGVLGLLTVLLIFYLSKEWFGFKAGIVSALLYAVSPINIYYSRSSWNPNPAPFFTLLAILALYRMHKTKNYRWLILVGVACAFLIQMHYLALIFVPVAVILWAHQLINELIIPKKPKKSFFMNTLLAILAFLLLMSPLAIFDVKYDYLNSRALLSFFSNRETTVNLNAVRASDRILPIYYHNLIDRYITQNYLILTWIVSILAIIPLFWAAYQRIKNKKIYWAYLLLGVWLILGVLGLSLYKQTIYDHYLGFLNPAPYILLGSVFFMIAQIKKKAIKLSLELLMVILTLSVVYVNLQHSPLLLTPNNQLKRTQDVSKFVIAQAGGKPYNFALIAKSNYDAAYQFYLDQYNFPPMAIKDQNTDQLIVVCEDEECNPIGNAKDEIARFGWALIADQQEYEGVKVYKLIHNPAQNDQPH